MTLYYTTGFILLAVIEMNYLTIGQVSRKANVGIETIRYYERLGLLPNPKRKSFSNYRQYKEDMIYRIKFIKNAQELGFSLKEIAELLSFRIQSKSTCADVRLRSRSKMTEIDEKIKSLKKIKKALRKLLKQCESGTRSSECPILDTFYERSVKNE